MALARRLTYLAREGGCPGLLTASGLSLLVEELNDVLGDGYEWADVLRKCGMIKYDEGSSAGTVMFYAADGLNRTHGGQYSNAASKGGVHSAIRRRKRRTDIECQTLALDLAPELRGYHDHHGKPLDQAQLKEVFRVIKTFDNCFEYARPETASGYSAELVASACGFQENYGHMMLEHGRRRHQRTMLEMLAYYLMDHRLDPSMPQSTEQVLSLADTLVKRVRLWAAETVKRQSNAA